MPAPTTTAATTSTTRKATTTASSPTTITTTVHTSAWPLIGAVIGAIVALVLILVAAVLIFRFYKNRNEESHADDSDMNPTYGDYEDYSAPVVEVEDANLYYSEVYVEGTSRVRDNNSTYNN